MKTPALKVQIDSDGCGLHFLILEESQKPIRVDVDFSKRNKIGLKSDLLARAIGYRASQKDEGQKLRIVDATAGLCRDSFHMASLGCHVLALEENKMLYRVVSDQISRLSDECHLKIENTEAKKYFKNWLANFSAENKNVDVVYLDPMFPEKRKSAKSGKESILLKLLAPIVSSEQETELLDLALQVATKRVVVKRPLSAPSLKPTHKKYLKPNIQFEGKAVRYDVYVCSYEGLGKG